MSSFFVKDGEFRVLPVVTLILLGSLLAYWQVHEFAFVNFDDFEYVVDNPAVRNGLSWVSVKWAFTAFYAANWHPLAWLSHMLDVSIFGLDAGRHHLVSLGWHLLNSVLLFFLLRRWGGGLWRCALVTTLFAWHPLRVESVAWVAERKDLLCAFFWLLTLIFYTLYSARPDWRRYLLTLFSAALALMAKPMAVTLPFLLLLLDYWPLQRYLKLGVLRLLLEKIPFFLLVLGSAALTFMAQHQAGAVSSAVELGLLPRLTNAIVAYVEYVKLLMWPRDLAVLYRYRVDYSMMRVLFSTLFLVACSGWVIRERRRYPVLLVGWCWFLGTLVPVIGLVQVGGQAWADRYTYFPAIGLWLALVWFGYEVCPRDRRRLVGGGLFVVALFFLSLTWYQSRYWRNSVTLFQRAATVDTENSVAYNLLGLALAKEERWLESDQAFARALQLNAHFGQALVNWGNALHEQGRNREAEQIYRKAMQPEVREIDAFVALAALRKQERRLDDAADILQKALQFAPYSPGVNYNLGTVLLSKGLVAESLQPLRQALDKRPYHIKTRVNLGIALARMGQLDEAEELFLAVLQFAPEHPQARYNLQQLKLLKERDSLRGGRSLLATVGDLPQRGLGPAGGSL